LRFHDDERLTRRHLLKGAGAAAVIAGAGPFLAACGDEGTTGAGATGGDPKGEVSGSTADRLREILELPTGKAAGEGLVLPLGASLALSGPSTYYGTQENKGIKLAAQHIEALGGPKFDLRIRDNGYADPTKAVALVREFGLDGMPVMLTSLAASFQAELPLYEQYSILSFDHSGAIAINEGKPFLYQGRAQIPADAIGGAVEYYKQTRPEAKRWSIVHRDSGGEVDKSSIELVQKAIRDAGFEVAGLERVAPDQTDFSAVLNAMRQQEPDVVYVGVVGALTTGFMKQYATSGIDAATVGTDFQALDAKAAGNAYDGYTFGFDFFNAQDPANEWAKVFNEAYQEAYSEEPDFYVANYYEGVFLIYELVRRLIESGKDPSESGEAYLEALNADLTFPSLYGGDGGATGLIEFDSGTHSLIRRPMIVCEANVDGEVGKTRVLARYDIGGSFELV
jgi:branched-chain amino acid transport system substrate-binding protein